MNETNTLRCGLAVASRPCSANHQRSAFMSGFSPAVGEPRYPPYNYTDHIPRPTVIYIKREEDADEMVASLNGQVTLSLSCSYSLASRANLPSAIGLDLEWPFSRDMADGEKEGKVALVQLCDVDIILLVHVCKMKSVYTLSLS